MIRGSVENYLHALGQCDQKFVFIQIPTLPGEIKSKDGGSICLVSLNVNHTRCLVCFGVYD